MRYPPPNPSTHTTIYKVLVPACLALIARVSGRARRLGGTDADAVVVHVEESGGVSSLGRYRCQLFDYWWSYLVLDVARVQRPVQLYPTRPIPDSATIGVAYSGVVKLCRQADIVARRLYGTEVG